MEAITVVFSNEESKSVKFEHSFPDDTYQVIVSPRESDSSESANVNLYIDDDLSDRHKVVIVASDKFTGEVDIIAIRIG